MAEVSESNTRVVVSYANLSAAKPVYVSGVQGTVTPSGTLNMCLYSEYVEPVSVIASDQDSASRYATESQRVSVDKDLGARPPRPVDLLIDDDYVFHLIRHMEVSVVMSKDTAQGVLAWLQVQVAKLEEAEESEEVENADEKSE